MGMGLLVIEAVRIDAGIGILVRGNHHRIRLQKGLHEVLGFLETDMRNLAHRLDETDLLAALLGKRLPQEGERVVHGLGALHEELEEFRLTTQHVDAILVSGRIASGALEIVLQLIHLFPQARRRPFRLVKAFDGVLVVRRLLIEHAGEGSNGGDHRVGVNGGIGIRHCVHPLLTV